MKSNIGEAARRGTVASGTFVLTGTMAAVYIFLNMKKLIFIAELCNFNFS
jgi:hypothetical protein